MVGIVELGLRLGQGQSSQKGVSSLRRHVWDCEIGLGLFSQQYGL